MYRTRHIVRGCCALGLATIACSAVALPPAPTEDGGFYYKIGGARPIAAPPNPIVTKISISAAASIKDGYSCGKFDPLASVTNTLNDVKTGVDAMANQLVSAATAAVASLPMYILHRANPDLYDNFQQALTYARDLASLSTKSCQQIEHEIIASKGTANPYANLATLAIGDSWKVQMGTEPSVTQAEKKVVADAGKNGYPHLGGVRAGGLGQPPIEPTGDTIFAGWNLTYNRNPADVGPPAAPPSGITVPMLAYWSTPQAAKTWVQTVIGDLQMTTYNGGDKRSIPGQGLEPELNTLAKGVQTKLVALITGAADPTSINLNEVSAPNIAVTRQLIESLRALAPGEQGAVIERFSNEIAMSRIIDKALMARQFLHAGRQEPNLVTNGALQAEVDAALAKLDSAIQSLVFSNRVRQEIVSSTALELLKYENHKRMQSLQRPNTMPNDPKPLKDSAVYQ